MCQLSVSEFWTMTKSKEGRRRHRITSEVQVRTIKWIQKENSPSNQPLKWNREKNHDFCHLINNNSDNNHNNNISIFLSHYVANVFLNVVIIHICICCICITTTTISPVCHYLRWHPQFWVIVHPIYRYTNTHTLTRINTYKCIPATCNLIRNVKLFVNILPTEQRKPFPYYYLLWLLNYKDCPESLVTCVPSSKRSGFL